MPLPNTFDTIWEYRDSFQAVKIDFVSVIGVYCPVCGREQCYRAITPYWRYAIDLFPECRKERIPVARFLCRQTRKTFSLLPIQLIPYFQYTVQAVIGTLLLGMQFWQTGQRGFHGAAKGVDPDSRVTPWLVTYWFMTVIKGFRRAHATLIHWYDLSGICSRKKEELYAEASGYFSVLEWKQENPRWALLALAFARYSRKTKLFLFGIPSQWRGREGLDYG